MSYTGSWEPLVNKSRQSGTNSVQLAGEIWNIAGLIKLLLHGTQLTIAEYMLSFVFKMYVDLHVTMNEKCSGVKF